MTPHLPLTVVLALMPLVASALDLRMPVPVHEMESRSAAAVSVDMAVGPFAGGTLPMRRVEGVLDQRAYRLQAKGQTLTALASPLRAQLEAQGFTVLLDCEARACGGFDFRFAIDVMPEPAMHVDLGEFRYISAERGTEVVSLLISRSASEGFVQMTRVGAVALPEVAPDETPVAVAPVAPVDVVPDAAIPEAAIPEAAVDLPSDLVGLMVAQGSVALDDLVFASGAAVLEPGEYASLTALAGWLREDPARSVMLVGHTDGSGGLKANVQLSKRRAEGAREVLLKMPGVAPSQVAAEGAGPLAPRATNLTEEGRRKNRRVEAVITSTQ